MLVFTLLISVHLASARFMVSMPVLKVIYGNAGSMDDLMLPPQSRRADFDTEVHGNHEELPDFPDFLREIEDMQQWSMFADAHVDGFHATLRKRCAATLHRVRASHNSLLAVVAERWDSALIRHWTSQHLSLGLKLNSSDLDLKDINDASKDLIDLKRDLETLAKDNTTRRQNQLPNLPHEVHRLWKQPWDLREWYYQKLCITFLIHIRFQVDAAIRQKMAVNSYPGYRIGYLFNKMFRLRLQMVRIREEWETMTVPRLIQNRPNWRTKKHSLQMLLQLYERVLQLDVDTKDTYEMINLLYHGRKMHVTEYKADPTQPFFK